MEKKMVEEVKDGYKLVKQVDGPELGYSSDSGVKILEVDGKFFKDLSGNGELDPYEDWRLSADERAKDLASKLSVEQIAGLMLYSSHQAIPAMPFGHRGGTYGGKTFEESGVKPWELTDQQKAFVKDDYLRHVLITTICDVKTGVKWNNSLQSFAEAQAFGVPANNSSDPRHGADRTKEFNMGGTVSKWPEHLGIAATFDPGVVKRFGQVAGAECRALGMTTALSPQSDLATEPRWGRFTGTFGEDPQLSTDMTKAYSDGFQTTFNVESGETAYDDGVSKSIDNDRREGANSKTGGWGKRSVNTMVKHWPGGGSGEGGRDAHFAYGKYAVYPGDNFDDHLRPFLEGAFDLEDGTLKASAVMPYYTISYGIDKKNGENVGNSYNKFLITDLLRNKYGYDGVVCTDWLITHDHGPEIKNFSGKCWGVETLSVAERHYKVLMAGCDQFGGNDDAGPVVEAYEMGVKEHGEEFMRTRFEESAVRLLRNIFRVGLFENPYLDVEESLSVVMCDEFMEAGEEAQKKSLVMLKNKDGVLPLKTKLKAYIPKRVSPTRPSWFGGDVPEKVSDPLDPEVAKDYFDLVDDASDADVAIVVARGPQNVQLMGGYDDKDLKAGGNGYVPISLQYRPYTAEFGRDKSIAGGDPLEAIDDRGYNGKTVKTYNEVDLDMILDTKKAMGDKPVIVMLELENPAVVSEFESLVDAIVVDFGISAQVVCELLTGGFEPSGLLPMQMPMDMKTVELQKEDVPRDMEPYVDSEGHAYDFGYGLDYSGVIKDWRTEKYC